MQISEMRVLRTFYSQRELIDLTRNRFFSNSTVFLSGSSENWRSSCNFRLSDRRTIHSSYRRHEEESSIDVDRPRSWSGSNSWAGELRSGRKDENPSVWTVYDPVTDKLVTRGGIGDSNVREEEANVSLSTFGSLDDNFSPGRSSEGFDKIKGEKSMFERTVSGVDNREGEKPRDLSGYTSIAQDVVLKKNKGKSKTCWVCSSCGNSSGQWWGTCHSCRLVGTMKEFSQSENIDSKVRGFDVSENAVRSWLPQQAAELRPQRLTDVNKGINQLKWRIPLFGLFGTEVARVLGGGLVPGSLVLVGGDPGVGKSTLLLQIAAMIAEGRDFGGPAPVLYVSGEESVEQIGNRADRMRIGTEELFLYSSTDIEDVLDQIQLLSPRALIVDSIQTVYLKGVTGSAGGLSQVKECTSALLRFAKKTNIPIFLVGHLTKTGDIAGPRVLEHIVDVVLYMEVGALLHGEKYSSYRLLRSVKNRFGSTDELGVFEMSQSGLQAVPNPSEIFLSEQHPDSEVLAGLAVAVIIDGSRTFLIEIQALCLSGSSVARHVNGVEASRADMIISVLMKQACLKLQENAIFLNVVSGVKLTETAGDLAIAAAICSSFLEFPIPNSIAFIGEIGLSGELRAVPGMEKRVNAVAKLGYKKCIVPKSAEKPLAALNVGKMMVLGCKNLIEVINTVFRAD
ncbi:hypothetical protein HHK36_025573 [Tetracentron sinense]|uniref:RecA family profile 1 domain-containing protein n=1 Tax=Tetracentron sinense TaxID=13715 RepID=A0A835D5P0_TETSI|nr:hypothetical protein HHK36_025573 [Tetracentron sinense]